MFLIFMNVKIIIHVKEVNKYMYIIHHIIIKFLYNDEFSIIYIIYYYLIGD